MFLSKHFIALVRTQEVYNVARSMRFCFNVLYFLRVVFESSCVKSDVEQAILELCLITMLGITIRSHAIVR